MEEDGFLLVKVLPIDETRAEDTTWKMVSCWEEKMAELIPGLPQSVALLCVARVPRIFHGPLKAVNTTWKEVIGGKEFYDVRKKLGVTDESVFMIKNYGKLRQYCMEIDLKTRMCSKAVFITDTLSRNIFIEGYGYVSVGHLVLFFGGYAFFEDGTPSGTLHVFNTLSRRWTNGANMQCPRREFGYGVIDGKLYVVGGLACAGQGVGLVTDAEVYDPEMDSWSRIANLPAAMHLDIFCVWRNQLLVRGMTLPEKKQLVYSYLPARNEWKEEKCLVNLLGSFKPLASAVTTKNDDCLHVGFTEQSGCMEGYVREVKVMKLDSTTLKWKSVAEYRDGVDSYSCKCRADGMRLNLFGLKDRVLVLTHLDRKDPQTFTSGVVKLYLESCPSSWTSTLVDA